MILYSVKTILNFDIINVKFRYCIKRIISNFKKNVDIRDIYSKTT